MHSSNPNGTAADYDYDGLNRLNSVTDSNLPAGNQKTTYSFDDVGNLSTVALPNGVTTSYSYNSVNRLLQLSTLNSQLSTLASYAYTVGPAGNRLSVSELGGRSVSYTYDNLYRLKSETIAGATGASPNGSISYAYDAVGNRQSRTSTVAGVPTQASVSVDDNDRLTTDGSDANGNTVTSNGKTYGYDFQNRLISVTGGGTSVSIVYDGDGNRVSKTVTTGSTSVTTKYLVDTNNPTGYSQVIEEIQNGSVTRQYTYGLALISQRTLNSQLSTLNFFGMDGHNNVRYLTDASGAKTDTYDYDAFGVLIASTGNTPNNYLYCGEQFDPDLGMYFLRARYLNPGTGRFWTMDSYGGNSSDPTSLHKYLYTSSDPVNRIDPSGNLEILQSLGAFSLAGLGGSLFYFKVAYQGRDLKYADVTGYRYGVVESSITRLEANLDPSISEIGKTLRQKLKENKIRYGRIYFLGIFFEAQWVLWGETHLSSLGTGSDDFIVLFEDFFNPNYTTSHTEEDIALLHEAYHLTQRDGGNSQAEQRAAHFI